MGFASFIYLCGVAPRRYLHGSIERQFAAFERGFRRLCKGPTLALFRAEELEQARALANLRLRHRLFDILTPACSIWTRTQLLCGNPEVDFQALERGATYDDGYTAQSPAVRWFWAAAHALSEEEKKRLLSFATGSDRVPIKGLHALPFVVSRNGTGDDRLPSGAQSAGAVGAGAGVGDAAAALRRPWQRCFSEPPSALGGRV